MLICLRDVKLVELPMSPPDGGSAPPEVLHTTPSYVVVRLRYALPSRARLSAASVRALFASWWSLVFTSAFWRFVAYDMAMTPCRNQWEQMSTLMFTFVT